MAIILEHISNSRHFVLVSLQILDLIPEDTAWLHDYLGYTSLHTTVDYGQMHRRPQDLAKIVILVMITEDDRGRIFRGRPLEEIDLNDRCQYFF